MVMSPTPSLPRIMDKAPDFEAVTTHGPIKLSEWAKDSWVVFFSHPADFTPVCTTEFMSFSDLWPEFQKRGVKLIGLSVDGIQSHIAWTRNIAEKQGKKVPFPVIADLNKDVASKYGMVHQNQSSTVTVRAVFVIDPKMTIRALIYYPLSLGRNMQEILRVIDALQTADKHSIATPANWKPGDKVIIPAPATDALADERVKDKTLEVIDWYLSKKQI